MAYGALTAEMSLLFDMIWALLLAALVFAPAARASRFSLLLWPALPFAMVILLAAFSTTGPRFAPFAVEPLLRSPMHTVDRSATWLEIIRLLGLGCAFGAGFCVGRSPRQAGVVVNATAYAGCAFALIALFVAAAQLIPQSQAHRIEAWFLNPNSAGAAFGALLCLSGPLSEPVVRPEAGLRRRLAAWGRRGAGAVLLIALLLTRSRAALGATAAALVLLVVLQAACHRLEPKRLAAPAVIAALLGLVALAQEQSVFSRFSSLGSDAALRRYIFDVHWANVLQRPWLGYGLGAFATLNRATLTAASFPRLWNINAAENVYLQWLVEGGVLGAGAMFLAIGSVVFISARGAVRQASRFRLLSILLSVDALFIIHGLFDFALETPSIALFWSVLLGVQFALATTESRKSAADAHIREAAGARPFPDHAHPEPVVSRRA